MRPDPVLTTAELRFRVTQKRAGGCEFGVKFRISRPITIWFSSYHLSVCRISANAQGSGAVVVGRTVGCPACVQTRPTAARGAPRPFNMDVDASLRPVTACATADTNRQGCSGESSLLSVSDCSAWRQRVPHLVEHTIDGEGYAEAKEHIEDVAADGIRARHPAMAVLGHGDGGQGVRYCTQKRLRANFRPLSSCRGPQATLKKCSCRSDSVTRD